MDLSMSEDFESSLLNWEEVGQQQQQPESEGMGSGTTSGSQTPLNGGPKQQPLTTQAMKEGFSRLPSFPTSIGGYAVTGEPQHSHTDAHGVVMTAGEQINPYTSALQMLYPLAGPTAAAQVNRSEGNQQQQQQHLMVQYALTGQSNGDPFPSVSFTTNKNQMDSVSCLSTTTGGYASSVARPSKSTAYVAVGATQQPGDQQRANGALPPAQLHPLGIPSSAGCPPMSSTAPPLASSMPNGTPVMQFNPYMFNPYTMAMAASNPQLFAAYQSSQQQQLAAHFAAAQASVAQVSAAQAPPASSAAPAKPPAAVFPPPAPVVKARPPKQQKPKAVKGKKTAAKKKKDDTPPFLLFDAPCELRQNFMATQRMLNLPVHQDGNSFHYGMAVNGFHPQLNMATDPPPLSAIGQLPPGVKLLDSRHKQQKGIGRERNEREQKRAQKITELIEQIRTSMEDGGWKVEMKSKYNTLSVCADYVKHLMKTTEEKEEAVEKAKSDLQVKERKLEEDKALLDCRSDPESVTSTLTASSAGSRRDGCAASRNAKPVSDDTSSKHKRKAEAVGATDMKKDDFKKAKAEETSADMSPADEGGSGNGRAPSGHNISIGKMSSSISELTDSNRGSDSGGEKTGRNGNSAHKKRPRSDEEGESSDIPASSSISSTAALFRGTGSHNRDHGHADVVIREKKHVRHRKRFRSERSSLDRKFEINYEEVFLTSNVPQIIATPAGRIVTWNKFFLEATCLDENSVKRLTIFSLVQQDKLANLFEMVAEALRRKPASAEPTSGTSSSSMTTNDPSSDDTEANPQAEEYATMTLPCASVLSARNDSDPSGESVKANPLYMTVTLMPDDDVSKRCFHCVFTDHKGADEKIGFITPELLAKLFTGPQSSSEKLKSQKPIATKTKSNNKESKGKELQVKAAAVDNGDVDIY